MIAERMSREEAARAQYEALAGVSFIAPYAETVEDLHNVRRSDIGERIGEIEHRALGEALRNYFQHPERRSANPRGVGLLPRRHVTILRHVAIGKESNAIALQAAEETDGAIGGREASIDAAQVFDHGTFQETLNRWNIAELVGATGLPRSTTRYLRSGRTKTPSPAILAALREGPPLLDHLAAKRSHPT
jgi:hypothetical protein